MISILSEGKYQLTCHNISTDANARSAKPKEKMPGVLIVTYYTLKLNSWQEHTERYKRIAPRRQLDL